MYICVAEERFHRCKVNTSHNEVGGVGVAKHMNGDVFLDSGLFRCSFEILDEIVGSLGIPFSAEYVGIIR